MKHRTVLCLLALAGGIAPDMAAAQPLPPAAAPAAGNVTIYDQTFFAQYAVVTARDLLERIPGMASVIGVQFQTAEQAQRRGLRSDTDQVLINGKRTTSKESDVSDYLQRIPANQVLRIEVISGNVREIDASVSGRVVNIVLKGDAGGAGSGAFALGGFVSPTGTSQPSGDVAYNYQNGGFSLTAGFEVRARIQPSQAYDTIRNPGGVAIGRRYENRERNRTDYSGRLRTGYTFGNGAGVQLAGFINRVPYDDADTAEVYAIVGARETLVSAVQDQTNGHEQRYEISTDLTVPVGQKVRVLGLGVFSDSEVETGSRIFNVAGAVPLEVAGDSRDEVKRQRIVRLTVQADFAAAHQLELGAEGANTTLDKDLDFFNLVAGRRVDIPVFNSDTMIDEDRAEVFASYTWKPGAFEIEPGVAAEFSKLRQQGPDANVTRTFDFVKPSLNVWYSPAPSTRVFLSALRDIGQLTFEDFAASFIREDNEVVAGNPNLVPEKTWSFELGVEQRLPRDAGVLQARGFYKRIDDVNDEVPLGAGVSGPGNLGRGTTYGGQFEWSFKLKSMQLFDATTGGTLTVQDSEVTDAFTGVKRRIGRQPEYELKIDYRHDISSLGFSYGFEANKSGASIESDFGKFDRRVVKRGDLRIFTETKLGWGLIARVFAGNLRQSFTVRDRIIFAVSQTDGRVAATERRRDRTKFFIGFRLRGIF